MYILLSLNFNDWAQMNRNNLGMVNNSTKNYVQKCITAILDTIGTLHHKHDKLKLPVTDKHLSWLGHSFSQHKDWQRKDG